MSSAVLASQAIETHRLDDDVSAKRHCVLPQAERPLPPQPHEWEAALAPLWPDESLWLFQLPTRAQCWIELYLVVFLHVDLGVFEFFVSQRGLAWRALRETYDPQYPHIERVTGSKMAALVGCNRHTSVPYDVWRGWTGQLRPGESMHVESNETMDYGNIHEARVRQILRMLLHCSIREPGFYLLVSNQLIGVSPDGVTPHIVLHGRRHTQTGRVYDVRMDLGVTVVELKCSPFGLKHCIQIEHMIQVHQEMFVSGRRRYAWLLYWHLDKICLFLIEFCEAFWKWLEQERDLFIECCKQKKELPTRSRVALGHRIQEEWFAESCYRVMPRPAEMRARFPPARPDYWLVFQDDCSRTDALQIDRRFKDTGELVYPVEHRDDDPWFSETWKPLWQEKWKCPALGPHLPLALQVTRIEIVNN